MTQYLIRCGKYGEHTWLRYLAGGQFGWASGRKDAARYDGKAAARRACDALEARIRAYYAGQGQECPPLCLAAVPASGGAAISRR